MIRIRSLKMMLTQTRDTILILLISLLRAYTTHTRILRGRYRLTSLLYALARQVRSSVPLTVTGHDGRRFRIDPRDPQYHMGLLDRGLFEPDETRLVCRCVKTGDVALDVGANFGWYTTLLSRLVGPNGTVHAFEAMPTTADVLKRNCGLNDCSNVVINQCALGDRRGSATIYDEPGRASGDASLFGAPGGHGRSHTCQMETLDEYFSARGLDRCDFIKCDVEGAELLFVRGARNVLKQHRPVILMEINPTLLARAGASAVELLEELRREGRYAFHVVGRPHESLEPRDCEHIDTYLNVLCQPS